MTYPDIKSDIQDFQWTDLQKKKKVVTSETSRSDIDFLLGKGNNNPSLLLDVSKV